MFFDEREWVDDGVLFLQHVGQAIIHYHCDGVQRAEEAVSYPQPARNVTRSGAEGEEAKI
jgi:hypothetical protein